MVDLRAKEEERRHGTSPDRGTGVALHEDMVHLHVSTNLTSGSLLGWNIGLVGKQIPETEDFMLLMSIQSAKSVSEDMEETLLRVEVDHFSQGKDQKESLYCVEYDDPTDTLILKKTETTLEEYHKMNQL